MSEVLEQRAQHAERACLETQEQLAKLERKNVKLAEVNVSLNKRLGKLQHDFTIVNERLMIADALEERCRAKRAAVRMVLDNSISFFGTFITLANLSAGMGQSGHYIAAKITDALTQHKAILQRAVEHLDA